MVLLALLLATTECALHHISAFRTPIYTQYSRVLMNHCLYKWRTWQVTNELYGSKVLCNVTCLYLCPYFQLSAVKSLKQDSLIFITNPKLILYQIGELTSKINDIPSQKRQYSIPENTECSEPTTEQFSTQKYLSTT